MRRNSPLVLVNSSKPVDLLEFSTAIRGTRFAPFPHRIHVSTVRVSRQSAGRTAGAEVTPGSAARSDSDRRVGADPARGRHARRLRARDSLSYASGSFAA